MWRRTSSLPAGLRGRSPSSSTTMFPAASSRRTPSSGRTAPPAASLFSRSSMRWSAGRTKRRPTFSISPSPPTRAASATRTPTAPRSAPPRAFATPGRICRCSTRSFSAPSPRRGSRSRAWCAPRSAPTAITRSILPSLRLTCCAAPVLPRTTAAISPRSPDRSGATVWP